MEDTSSKMARGAAWMVLFKLAERSLGLLSIVVLARLLAPEDFGLIAMATAFVAILELIGSFGFDIALIQRRDADRTLFDTAWTLNVLTSVVIALLMVASALPVARFYDEPRVALVICALAAGSIVQGFENIGVVTFRMQMRFDREFSFQLAKKVAALAVGIPLAVVLRNYWALVAGMVFGRVVSVAYSYLVHEYRPRFSLAARGELLGFSKWLMVNNLLTFFRDRLADFVVGRVNGAKSLGLYSVAHEIGHLPTTELVMPINRAVFPGYARLHHGDGSLQAGFLSVIGLIALFALPAGVGVAAVSDLVTAAVLGPKWLDAGPLVAVLGFAGAMLSLQTNSYSVFLATGKPALQTVVLGVYLACLVPSMLWLTTTFGVVGAAWSCVASSAVMLPVNYALVLRELRLSAGALHAMLWRPAIGAALMYVAVVALREALPPAHELSLQLAHLAAAVSVGVAVYGLAIYLLWQVAGQPPGPERVLAERAAALFARPGAGRSGG